MIRSLLLLLHHREVGMVTTTRVERQTGVEISSREERSQRPANLENVDLDGVTLRKRSTCPVSQRP